MNFAALRDAHPNLWQAAADNLTQLAREADHATQHLRDKSREVSQHWQDQVGERAVEALRQLADRYEVTGIDLHAAASVLDGLKEGVLLAQRSLQEAIDAAIQNGCQVDDAGRVSSLDGTARYGHLQQAIDDAVHEADEIDNIAAADLQRLTRPDVVDDIDVERALAAQDCDAGDQVRLIRAGLPRDRSPREVSEWWSSLTPKQREELERAVPVDLYELNGIPKDVKDALRGHDGYDRIKLLQYALDHWNDKRIDIYDSNCANFVATAFDFAGLKGRLDWRVRQDSWGQLSLPIGSQFVQRRERAETWYNAQLQYEFFANHGGQSIRDPSQARPGDLIYWEQRDGTNPGGKIHHVAIVTSVTPEGDIHYTQHSPSLQDASLMGRSTNETLTEGAQNVHIVRVHGNW